MYTSLRSQWEVTTFQTELDELLYRSNLLGSQKSITNFGGGNTSAKIFQNDPLSMKNTEVLWVKGSGGDLGSMDKSGFASLYMEKLIQLEPLYHALDVVEKDDAMAGLIPHCIFNQNPRAPSIDTNLHAFLPFKHIDHMHPDAIISIATASNGKAICHQIFDGRIAWLEWKRPGFELGSQLKNLSKNNPGIEGVILQHHGLFTWGDTSESCYNNTIQTINQAIEAINVALKNNSVPAKKADLDETEKGVIVPLLRNALSHDTSKVCYINTTEAVLNFVSSQECKRLSNLGTSCPDHFLRTKIKPMVISSREIQDEKLLEQRLDAYRKDYKRYYDACKTDTSPAIRDSNPVIVLVPCIGMFGFAANRTQARIATEFFENAINVMMGAEALSEYTSLDEQEAFNIEYWLMEEAKLKRMPAPKPLTGKVALVTGAAGGIGRTLVQHFLDEGACVVCCDIHEGRLQKLEETLDDTLGGKYSKDMLLSIKMDVTDEANVIAAVSEALVEFGGVDILVANAGIASASAFEDTSLDIWNLNQSVLSLGYFLISREVFRAMKNGGGGSIVFIGSKNALASSAGAAAYSAAKAASVHLARCLALEGAPYKIRVNTVNPDAVLEDSAIWSGEWREQRAQGYGIEVSELEKFYQDRSLLKLNVRPFDIAKAVMFFATEDSSRSTGNIINVDAGNATAFTR